MILLFKTCPQRFPTEDHLMIHRHKHEMTLKFPSIKNDNMLSGELHAAPRCDLPRQSSPRAFPCTCVRVGVSCPDRHARFSSKKNPNGATVVVVYYCVNHATLLRFIQRSLFCARRSAAEESACQSFSSSVPFMKKRVDVALI